jgi:hypothetical protein
MMKTAQCYPNSDSCPPGTTLVTDTPHREYDKCAEMVVGVIPMVHIISKDHEGQCPDGYDMTKDAKKCVRAGEVDCDDNSNSPLCT